MVYKTGPTRGSKCDIGVNMNFPEAQVQIQAYLEINWVTTPIHFQNNKFTPKKKYIRCHVLFGDSSQKTLGSNPEFRNPGVVVIQVLSEQGQGPIPALEMANTLSDMFKAKNISGIQFGTPTLAILGEIESYYQINVQCPFYFDTQS